MQATGLVLNTEHRKQGPFRINANLIKLRKRSKEGPAQKNSVYGGIDTAAHSAANPNQVRAYAMLCLLDIEGLFEPRNDDIELKNPTANEIREMGGRGDSEGEINITDAKFPLGPALRLCGGYLRTASFPSYFGEQNELDNHLKEQLKTLSKALENLSGQVKKIERYPQIKVIIDNILEILEGNKSLEETNLHL